MGFTCFKKKDENYELVCFVALREFFYYTKCGSFRESKHKVPS